MNLRYMMLKDKYIFSSYPHLALFSPDDDKRRSYEIPLYIKELTLYGTSLKLLTKLRPTSKVKDELLNIAAICAEETLFFNSIKQARKLPIKKLSQFTDKSKAFIEKWQYYILAYFILLSNKSYNHLKNYLNIRNIKADSQDNGPVSLHPLDNSKNQFTGVTLQLKANAVYVITAQGDFIILSAEGSSELSIGQLYTSTIKRDLSYYKYPIALGSACLIALLFFLSYLYMRPNRTIIVNANSSILLKTNSFNRTVEVRALSGNGNKIIKPLILFNRSLDDSLYLILKEAREKEILKDNTAVTVFITGTAKEAPDFIKTSAYISEQDLQISINNNGIEHKIKKVQTK